MSILKCKMCGGDLEIAEEINIVECEYCGTKQTVPNADNEKKINLFNRANRLRMASEFDKAASIYENIIAEFPEEAEAYWGLCLCNYGIEYVDDPATAKKIPTCHRASFESLMKDESFNLALEYADVVAQKVYRDEAREIDRIMQDILAVSKNEKPYDVFICYKETDEKGERTVDSVLAYDIYEALTAKGFNVFFSRVTLEDKLGRQYEPYIFAALNSAKVMLSVGTKYEYFHAVWVKNEWSRFLKIAAKDKSKVLIPCYKDIDAYDMPDEFKALQAQDLGKLGAVQDIVRGVEKIISKNESAQVKETVVVSQSGGPNVEALLKRGNMALEDGEWNNAKEYFDQVLNMNAECAEAYLGLAMAEEKVKTKKSFVAKNNLSNKNYIRAKKYADKALKDKLIAIEKEIKEERRRQKAEAEKERNRKSEEDKKRLSPIRKQIEPFHGLLAAGIWHTAGLKSTGAVIAAYRGDNINKCFNQHVVSTWMNIIAICSGSYHTVGLKLDDTVVAIGRNDDNQCNVTNWTDIVAISAGDRHTVGLKSDGTVVAVGCNKSGQCDVYRWTDIVAINTGHHHTIGLKSDGTVVAAGSNIYGECNINDWTDIVAVAAGYSHTVGLKSDGTVVAVGECRSCKYGVADWTDIVAISAGAYHTVGLKSNGAVVAVGDNKHWQCNVKDWTDIVAISAGWHHTVGLKKDGTVVATPYGGGDYNMWKRAIADWKLFDSFENFEEERKVKMAEKRIAEEIRMAELKKIEEQKATRRSQNLCQHCGGSFKGLFTKKCTACGKEKDY